MIPSTGTLTAQVQVPGPGGSHVLQQKYIISASSHTFTLGRIGVILVVIYEGKPVRFPYELPFLRLYTQLTSALVSMVENKSNTHPSFSHPPLVRKADGCVYFIIVIDVTRSHAASISKTTKNFLPFWAFRRLFRLPTSLNKFTPPQILRL
jgi:hypothetical protein